MLSDISVMSVAGNTVQILKMMSICRRILINDRFFTLAVSQQKREAISIHNTSRQLLVNRAHASQQHTHCSSLFENLL